MIEPNKSPATSEIDVNVFSKISPFIISCCLQSAMELIATAPPKLRPNTTKGSLLLIDCYMACCNMAAPSLFIPVSDGVPLLSE